MVGAPGIINFETGDVELWHFKVENISLVCQLVYWKIKYFATLIFKREGSTITIITTTIPGFWWHGGVGKAQIQQRGRHTQGWELRRPTT